MKHIVALARTIIVILLLACATTTSALAGPTVLFDQGHGQRFFLDKTGPLDLSSFAGVFRDAGYTVRIGEGALTDKSLTGVDVLVVSGAFQPFTAADLDTVTTFLGRGGRLCVMLHIGVPVGTLLQHIGVDYSNGVIHEKENLIMGDPLNFEVTRLESHPLLAGLQRFSLYGAWALMNVSDDARIIARTSPSSWIDLDGNQKLSYGDAVQSFGVAVAGRYGKGNFVVFGDDAIFQNKFLGPDNMRLAKNLAEWLKGEKKPQPGTMTGTMGLMAGI